MSIDLLSEESITRLIDLSTDAAEGELLSMYRTFRKHEVFMTHLELHLAHLNDIKNLYQQLKEVLRSKELDLTQKLSEAQTELDLSQKDNEFTEPDRIGNKGDKHE